MCKVYIQQLLAYINIKTKQHFYIIWKYLAYKLHWLVVTYVITYNAEIAQDYWLEKKMNPKSILPCSYASKNLWSFPKIRPITN